MEGTVTPIRKPDVGARRARLVEARLAALGELAEARQTVTGLEAQVNRLEGGIIECDWLAEQMKETSDEA